VASTNNRHERREGGRGRWGSGGGVEVCKRRNSNRKETLKRRKTYDFNMKKTNAVINKKHH
jgi:hypothetical protein